MVVRRQGHADDAGREQGGPQPGGEAADPAVAGDELRRAGDDQGHHHQHQGAPIAHARRPVDGGGPARDRVPGRVEQPGGRIGQPHGWRLSVLGK